MSFPEAPGCKTSVTLLVSNRKKEWAWGSKRHTPQTATKRTLQELLHRWPKGISELQDPLNHHNRTNGKGVYKPVGDILKVGG